MKMKPEGLGVLQWVIVYCLWIGAIGLYNGFHHRIIRVNFGPYFNVMTVRGVKAIFIGIVCIPFGVTGIWLCVIYLRLLHQYCQASVICEIASPIFFVASNPATAFLTACLMFVILQWLLQSGEDSYILAPGVVYRGSEIRKRIRQKLQQANQPLMTEKQMDDVKNIVEMYANWFEVSSPKKYMTEGQLDEHKIYDSLMQQKGFPESGPAFAQAVAAVVEVYVDARNKAAKRNPIARFIMQLRAH